MKKNRFNKKTLSLKTSVVIFIIIMFLITGLSGCQKVSFIPGASYGYYIWEDEDENIHIDWSIDRKESAFSGIIKSDGVINLIKLNDWEDDTDKIEVNDSFSIFSFDAQLNSDDYSDGIVLNINDYDSISFDLMVNDGYDLERIHIGRFSNNPDEAVFTIGEGYFDDIEEVPFYKQSPIYDFLFKISSNLYFTLVYTFIIGVVVIELIRITSIRKKPEKKRRIYIIICYSVLIVLEIILYFLLANLKL